MRARIHPFKLLSVNFCIALSGRNRCVAKQLLDGAQIATASQKRRCKAVTQGMRGRAVRHAKRRPCPLHLPLHNARGQTFAAHGEK